MGAMLDSLQQPSPQRPISVSDMRCRDRGVLAVRREPEMERQIELGTNSVELRIWREEGGAWRCRVLTPDGMHTVRLDDQAALSAYIAGQIDVFVREYELEARSV
jgi:hypothetical protein